MAYIFNLPKHSKILAFNMLSVAHPNNLGW